MKKQGTLWLVIALAVLIAGASFGYKALTQQQAQQAEMEQKKDLPSEKNTDTENKDQKEEDPQKDVQPKHMAPNFTVFDINGEQVNFDSFEGKPTVINFWASW
ncbi:MAG: redoxin domain-containing protein [Peptostreptococcaceae bacterium]|nr:redoxin domain-containing protein [Peptostreptococcaceae bacterium]